MIMLVQRKDWFGCVYQAETTGVLPRSLDSFLCLFRKPLLALRLRVRSGLSAAVGPRWAAGGEGGGPPGNATGVPGGKRAAVGRTGELTGELSGDETNGSPHTGAAVGGAAPVEARLVLLLAATVATGGEMDMDAAARSAAAVRSARSARSEASVGMVPET